MSLEIPADLPPALMPVVWLLGSWEGAGVATRPADGVQYRFGERVTFGHDGRSFLTYDSTLWQLDDAGDRIEIDARETGFWRVEPDGSVELVMASAAGVVEIYVGRAEGPRIEVATDIVGRTATAEPYTAGRRMYGSVEGDLLYAYDAGFENDGRDGLFSLRSARLRRAAA